MADIEWMHGFRKINSNLSLRKPENTNASSAFNRTAVNEFFENLKKTYDLYKFTIDRIFNFDECGISRVLDTLKVLAEKTQ